jgi:adenosylcobinamide kinase/adenosylcobinamide-phosphate guanylyltransferase
MPTLVLGGQRSGKSRYAESLMPSDGRPVTYIATAIGNDEAMRERIRAHRAYRPSHWQTVECQGHLAADLAANDGPDAYQLVDCLTLWLTALIDDADGAARGIDALTETLPQLSGTVVLVSNETGLGVVPMDAISRRFVDLAGRMNQAVASCCERVVFMAAGLPMHLKGTQP